MELLITTTNLKFSPWQSSNTFGVQPEVNRLKIQANKNQNKLLMLYKRRNCCNLTPVVLNKELQNVNDPIKSFPRMLLLREVCMFYLTNPYG